MLCCLCISVLAATVSTTTTLQNSNGGLVTGFLVTLPVSVCTGEFIVSCSSSSVGGAFVLCGIQYSTGYNLTTSLVSTATASNIVANFDMNQNCNGESVTAFVSNSAAAISQVTVVWLPMITPTVNIVRVGGTTIGTTIPISVSTPLSISVDSYSVQLPVNIISSITPIAVYTNQTDLSVTMTQVNNTQQTYNQTTQLQCESTAEASLCSQVVAAVCTSGLCFWNFPNIPVPTIGVVRVDYVASCTLPSTPVGVVAFFQVFVQGGLISYYNFIASPGAQSKGTFYVSASIVNQNQLNFYGSNPLTSVVKDVQCQIGVSLTNTTLSKNAFLHTYIDTNLPSITIASNQAVSITGANFGTYGLDINIKGVGNTGPLTNKVPISAGSGDITFPSIKIDGDESTSLPVKISGGSQTLNVTFPPVIIELAVNNSLHNPFYVTDTNNNQFNNSQSNPLYISALPSYQTSYAGGPPQAYFYPLDSVSETELIEMLQKVEKDLITDNNESNEKLKKYKKEIEEKIINFKHKN